MVGDSTQVKTPTGAPCAMAVSYMIRMASWQQCQAFGWGAKITAFRVLMAMMHLKSTVDVGLVTGVIEKISPIGSATRSEEHTSELQSLRHLVCRLLLE